MKKIIRTTTAKKVPMKQTVVMLALVLAIGIAGGMIGCQGAKTPQEPVKVTLLQTADLAESPGKVANTYIVELAPGATITEHYHPGRLFVYLVEGSLVTEEKGKPSATVKPGEFFTEWSSQEKAAYVQVHKNTSKKDSLKVLVVQVTEKGQPLLIPVK